MVATKSPHLSQVGVAACGSLLLVVGCSLMTGTAGSRADGKDLGGIAEVATASVGGAPVDCRQDFGPWDRAWMADDSTSLAATSSILEGTGLSGAAERILDFSGQNGVNPAFALAMFRKEAGFAEDGTRAARNRNPGNIRETGECRGLPAGSDCAGVYGEVSTDGAFGVYSTMTDGIEAYFKLLATEYTASSRRQCEDIACVINAYAPPSENDTTSYVEQVTQWTEDYQCLLAGSEGLHPIPSGGESGAAVGTVSLIASLSGPQNEENVWLTALDTGERSQITTDAGLQLDGGGSFVAMRQYRDLSWSPTGMDLAFVESSYSATPGSQSAETLWLHDLAAGSARELAELEHIAGYDWSPDGGVIAFGRDIPDMSNGPSAPGGAVHGIWTVNIASGEMTEAVRAERGFPLARPKWSPDGRYLAFEEVQFIEGAGLFGLYDTVQESYVAWDRILGTYDWDADGENLVYDGLVYAPEPGARIWTISVHGGTPIPLTPAEPEMASLMPSVSPVGDMIAFFRVDPNGFSGKGSLWVMVANGGTRKEVLSDLVPQRVVWDPTGREIVVERWVGNATECVAVDAATSEVRPLVVGSSCAWRPIAVPSS